MSGGTLQRLALTLADALAALSEALSADDVSSTLSQLGLQLPAGFTPSAALTTAAKTIADAANQLPAHSLALSAAIDADNVATIISEGFSTLTQVGHVLDGIDALAGSLPGLLGGGIGAGDASAFGAQFVERLFSYTVVRYLEERHPKTLGALGLTGVVDRMTTTNIGGTGTHLARELHLDRIAGFVSNPGATLQSVTGWGTTGFDGRQLLPRIATFLQAMGNPTAYDDATPTLHTFLLSMTPTTGPGTPGLAVTINKAIPAASGASVNIDPQTTVDAQLDNALPEGTTLELRPPGAISSHPSTQLGGRLRFGITRHADPGDALTLLGVAGGVGIRAASIGLSLVSELAWNAGTGQSTGALGLSGDVTGGKLSLDFGDADGFLGTILKAVKLDADVDFGFDWSVDGGLRFRGSSALDIKLPAHLSLGPISIDGLTLRVGVAPDKFPVALLADVGASLGILDIVVQEVGLGIDLSLPAGGRGDVGPLDLDFHFQAPTGAGITVDTAVLTGGGFLKFDEPAGEYFGALELSFKGFIDIKAFGLINTKFPDGKKGFAFLVLITAEFTPIQLGFGFTLLGVGGLLSLNRTLDTDALMAGVKTGAINSIMFPPDIVANIARIASDIKTLFPIAEGHVIVAPMAKLGWGTPTLISVEVGIILDIPVPALVIIGVLRINLPTEDAPLLRLQVNFAGGIDFDRGLIWFNASLFDSRLIAFTLTGDMALRIGWGSGPLLIISVGGFHPAFREIPDDLRNMTRMTIALLSGNNPRLTVQTYFAVTSNTVQNGARVELYAAACGFNIYGFLGYDLLVQFNPFHFIASIAAGIALRDGNSVIAGISVHGELSGPAPWNANGRASLEILFFEISVHFNETWGDDPPPDPVEIENVTKLVVDALNDDRNWKSIAPPNSTTGVTVRNMALPEGQIVLQPFGVLAVSQKVVPLAYPLEKFGNKKPDTDRFELTTALSGVDDEREEFAVAQYKKLSDSDKLSALSFEQMKSGLRFSTGDAADYGPRVVCDVDYELSYVHRSRGLIIIAGIFNIFGTLFSVLAGGSGIAKNAFSQAKKGAVTPAAVTINRGEYLVVGVADLSPVAGATARTMAEAVAMHDALVASDPTLGGQLQVVAAHELAGAA